MYSEDVAGGLGDRICALNLRVLALIESPELLGTLLFHFDLDVVLADIVLPQHELTRVLDQDARVAALDNIANNVSCCASG